MLRRFAIKHSYRGVDITGIFDGGSLDWYAATPTGTMIRAKSPGLIRKILDSHVFGG
jgi:hypothetical protein